MAEGKMKKRRVYSSDVLLLMLVAFFSMSCTFALNALIGGYAGELGATGSLVGLVGSAASFAALLSRTFSGKITDAMEKYRVEALGLILMALACFAYWLALSPEVLFVARLVQGAGFSCCSACVGAWISNLVSREKIGSVMGVYGMVNALSMAVMPAVGVVLIAAIGYRSTMGLIGLLPIASLLLIQFVRDKGEPESVQKKAHDGLLRGSISIAALPVALIMMLISIPYFATQVFLVQYVTSKGLALAAGLFFPVYAAVLIVFRLALTRLVDRVAYGYFLVAGCACQLVSMLLLANLSSTFMLILAAIAMAGGFGVLTTVSQATALLLVPPTESGAANSTYFAGTDLGTALGALLGGIVIESAGLDALYPSMYMVIPVVLVLYLLFRKRIRPVV